MEEDYYHTLGISRDASKSDIEAAYRKMAQKYHPDMNPDDKTAKEKFQQVQRAYDVLKDPNKRDQYDRYGSSFESMGGGPHGGQGPFGGGFHGGAGFEDIDLSELLRGQFGGGAQQAQPGGFSDIFRQFTGGGRGGRKKRQPQKGSDIQTTVSLSFQKAITGGKEELQFLLPDGRSRTITLTIAPGTEDGQKIRLRGQGETPPAGGQAGDLIVNVRVAAHPCFSRDGKNLDVRVPVTIAEAALGAKVDVPTPRGDVTVTIPPGTSSGRRLRLKGLGIAPKIGDPGDLFAEVQIVLPETIDDETVELIRKLDDNQSNDPRKGLCW
jgi:DnaJ-class molecular chaperone